MSVATVEAYEPADPNEWVRPIAVTVTTLLIAWNVTGWFLDKGLTFEGFFIAAMTASFQALSFNASAQMRRAGAKVQTASIRKAHRFWKGVLFMCSGWAAYSAHHGYGVIVGTEITLDWSVVSLLAILSAAPAIVVLTVAAFIEPFLPWAIETVEAAPKAKPLAAVPTPAPANDGNASGHAARTVARELSQQAASGASRRNRDTIQPRVANRAPPLSEQAIREAIAALTADNKVVSLRSVASFHGVPTSRVERSAHYRLLKQAA